MQPEPHKRMGADLPPVEISDGHLVRSPSSSNPASPSVDPASRKGSSKLTSFFKGLFVSKGSQAGEDKDSAQQSDLASGLVSPGHIRPGSVHADSATKHHAAMTSPKPHGAGMVVPSPPNAGVSHASPRPQPQQLVPSVPRPLSTPDKNSVVMLAVAPVLPPKMARPTWCLKDFAIVEKMYTGYASTVYKAWCKASGETVCLKVSCSALWHAVMPDAA